VGGAGCIAFVFSTSSTLPWRRDLLSTATMEGSLFRPYVQESAGSSEIMPARNVKLDLSLMYVQY